MHAIKFTPFDRYATLDVVCGVAASGSADQVARYTGNDDHIVYDLAAGYRVPAGSGDVHVRFAGGLLEHWAVWTRTAVRLWERLETARTGSIPIAELSSLAPAPRPLRPQISARGGGPRYGSNPTRLRRRARVVFTATAHSQAWCVEPR